jgi:hypothetical protein
MAGDGTILVSYIDRDGQDLDFVHCDDVLCSTHQYAQAQRISLHDFGATNSLTIGPDGLGLAVGLDAVTGSLVVVHCSIANCGISTTRSLRMLSADASISRGADGLPMIATYAPGAGHLYSVHCGDALCSSGNTLVATDNGPNVGQAPALTVGVDGLPFVSYYDGNAHALKTTHCSSVFCAPYLSQR